MKASVSKYKRLALAMILFAGALFLLILPYYQPGEIPYLLLSLGRLHPLILHFPIVLIIMALILELLRRRNKMADTVITVILAMAVVSTLVSIGSGFLLYASGDYSGPLPQKHLWTGVITGICILCTAALYFLYRHSKKFYAFYLAGLLISNGAVAYASHLGGSLTHGQDYLTEYFPLIMSKTQTEAKPESQMLVYEDMINPVIEAKCASCHNDNRAKGELSMSSLQHIIKGGESDKPGIIAGNADSSEIYRRIVLPEDDEDRMPPKGKTPFTDAETSLLKYWIRSGATQDLHIKDVRGDTTISRVVNLILPELKRYRVKQQIARIKNEQLQIALDTVARQLNITIRRDTSSDDVLYTIAMKFPPGRFTGEQLHELSPYNEVFSRISLVSSGIEDDGLYHIGQMTNLRALYLQKTNLNGTGIIHLKNLQNLEVLNLSYTKIDDRAALDLLKIPNLREVYLFQTKTSVEVIRALQEHKPSLRILMEEGPYL